MLRGPLKKLLLRLSTSWQSQTTSICRLNSNKLGASVIFCGEWRKKHVVYQVSRYTIYSVFIFILLLLRSRSHSFTGNTLNACLIAFSEPAGIVSCLLWPQEKDFRGLTCPLIPASQGGHSIIPASIHRTTWHHRKGSKAFFHQIGQALTKLRHPG